MEWASISAGGWHTVGITTSGAAYAWGDNFSGQLGDGTTIDRLAPVLVSGGYTWASISAGSGWHTVGLTTSGDAYAWGFNGNSQLGDGTTTDRTTPVLVSPRPSASLGLRLRQDIDRTLDQGRDEGAPDRPVRALQPTSPSDLE